MNMKVPLAEALDKYSILMLKMERLSAEQKDKTPFLKEEFEYYEKVLDAYREEGVDVKKEWIDGLKEINGKCWDMEADIRQGKEGKLGLEEVGRRALILRDFNKERIALKNKVMKESGVGFLEIKVSHGSE